MAGRPAPVGRRDVALPDLKVGPVTPVRRRVSGLIFEFIP